MYNLEGVTHSQNVSNKQSSNKQTSSSSPFWEDIIILSGNHKIQNHLENHENILSIMEQWRRRKMTGNIKIPIVCNYDIRCIGQTDRKTKL